MDTKEQKIMQKYGPIPRILPFQEIGGKNPDIHAKNMTLHQEFLFPKKLEVEKTQSRSMAYMSNDGP